MTAQPTAARAVLALVAAASRPARSDPYISYRRRILDLLREQEQAVGDLVSALGLSQPGVSKHLRVLRAAGLVEVRTDAQRRVYRLRTEPLREIDEWLAPYRAAWAGRLGALEAHLDDMDN